MKSFLKTEKISIFSTQLQSKLGYFWIKFILGVLFFSLIQVLFIFRFILSAHIYIPGFYSISQTIVYQIEGSLNKLSGPFFYRDFFFYVFGFLINLPLLIAAYFCIGKRYGTLSTLAVIIWTVCGLLSTLKVIKYSVFLNNLDFNITAQGAAITKEVQYYIIALFTGCLSGFIGSFIWKQNISLGGLDIVFTYLAIKKRKEIQKVTLPVASCFAIFSILINQVAQPGFSLVVFLGFLFSSLLFIYTRSTVVNYLFPKYKIVSILIITQKGEAVCNKLRKFYFRGGNIVSTKGMYDQKDKTMIITAMTYLEKDLFVSQLKKIDPDAFFIGLNVHFLEGRFLFHK